jgi:hypothetical protein
MSIYGQIPPNLPLTPFVFDAIYEYPREDSATEE